jgi:hypothetical protein
VGGQQRQATAHGSPNVRRETFIPLVNLHCRDQRPLSFRASAPGTSVTQMNRWTPPAYRRRMETV